MKLLKRIIIVFTGVLFITSCKKTLEVLPKNSIDAGVALADATGIEGLLNAAYNDLQNTTYYGRDFIVISEVLSDNMRVVNSNSNRFVNESNNAISATINIWARAYATINKLNGIVENVDAVPGFTDARRNQVKGEALFLRALVYFDLAKSYGYNPNHIPAGKSDLGVPIVLKYVKNFPGDIIYPVRNKNSEVFAQVKKDLDAAIPLLIIDNSLAPIHATKLAALGYRARLALFLEEWADAVNYSTQVIDAPGASYNKFVSVPADYNTIWTSKSSPESIFELNFEISESTGSDMLTAIYTRTNPVTTVGSGYGDIAPQANLMANYEAGDVRKNLLVPIAKGGENILWNQKYPAAKGAQLDNIKLMRISEMYLIRAEANMRIGNVMPAQADLDKIRLRAGLLATPVTLDAVLKERRVELAYEGFRWFDLIRLGLNVNKSTTTLPANAVPSSTIPFDDFKILAKIPQTEIDINKQLIQNFGY